MTLVEFLLARIAEDEVEIVANAQELTAFGQVVRRTYRPETRRWAAECQAKRAILEMHTGTYPDSNGVLSCEMCSQSEPTGMYSYDEPHPCQTLRLLAQPYADHPDYDESWRA